jgi:hypothetical protein
MSFLVSFSLDMDNAAIGEVTRGDWFCGLSCWQGPQTGSGTSSSAQCC